ncbi:RNA-binding protein NOB1 [Vairimorpha necatrix]|uniref:RNA-binding protein NOB1 n=1 Tax=Vairimorpha necatrix TaxID=6039 RepID=A0AAX4JA40_9MICR
MIAVVDTCYFLRRGTISQNINKIIIPDSVKRELINDQSKEFYNLYKFMIEIRNPSSSYIDQIHKLNEKMHFNLSQADVEVSALTLELHEIFCNTWVDKTNINDLEDVTCLTLDNGIKQCLRYLNLYEDNQFISKKFKMRCFACFSTYEEKIDFCKKCGLNTISRVSVVVDENNKEKLLLKKNYKFQPKILYGAKGVEIKSSGQREYEQFIKMKGYKNKKKPLTEVLGDLND